MVTHLGPLAAICCELRQAWKGATVTAASGVGCGWMGYLHIPPFSTHHNKQPQEFLPYQCQINLTSASIRGRWNRR